jgi:hypothetical protein
MYSLSTILPLSLSISPLISHLATISPLLYLANSQLHTLRDDTPYTFPDETANRTKINNYNYKIHYKEQKLIHKYN